MVAMVAMVAMVVLFGFCRSDLQSIPDDPCRWSTQTWRQQRFQGFGPQPSGKSVTCWRHSPLMGRPRRIGMWIWAMRMSGFRAISKEKKTWTAKLICIWLYLYHVFFGSWSSKKLRYFTCYILAEVRTTCTVSWNHKPQLERRKSGDQRWPSHKVRLDRITASGLC